MRPTSLLVLCFSVLAACGHAPAAPAPQLTWTRFLTQPNRGEVYAEDPLPPEADVFLVGCTRRNPEGAARLPDTVGVDGSWRADAVRLLRAEGVRGYIILPEFRDGHRPENKVENARWEKRAIDRSKVVLAWAPVGPVFGQGLTTRAEVGMRFGQGRPIAFGAPRESDEDHGGTWYLRQLFTDRGDKTGYTLAETVDLTVGLLRAVGQLRP